MLFKNDLEGGVGEGGGCFLGMQHADVRCSFFFHGGKVGPFFRLGKQMEENPAIPENQGCPSRNCTLFFPSAEYVSLKNVSQTNCKGLDLPGLNFLF